MTNKDIYMKPMSNLLTYMQVFPFLVVSSKFQSAGSNLTNDNFVERHPCGDILAVLGNGVGFCLDTIIPLKGF